MGENEDEKQAQASQVFENFVQATTCKGTLQAFNILTCLLDLDPLDHRNFYSQLKSKVNTWKAKALWHKLDKRGSHKEYKRGKACSNTKVKGTPMDAPRPCGTGSCYSCCVWVSYCGSLRGRFPLSGRTALKPILFSWPQLPLCTIPKEGNQSKMEGVKQMSPSYFLRFPSLQPCFPPVGPTVY